ncbi:MAG: hypothetical protein ACLQK8_16970 [Streptosporangiaceae bacterium]
MSISDSANPVSIASFPPVVTSPSAIVYPGAASREDDERGHRRTLRWLWELKGG